MTQYRRGRAIEWKARKELESRGFTVIRSAGSKGVFDLVALDANSLILIQVKRANRLGKQYPAVIKQIQAVPCPPGTLKQLWVWIDRYGWARYPV